MAEVEKIWILYDLDDNGELDYEEMADYLKDMTYPYLNLTDDEISKMASKIDIDQSGLIDKKEMTNFVLELIQADRSI